MITMSKVKEDYREIEMWLNSFHTSAKKCIEIKTILDRGNIKQSLQTPSSDEIVKELNIYKEFVKEVSDITQGAWFEEEDNAMFEFNCIYNLVEKLHKDLNGGE